VLHRRVETRAIQARSGRANLPALPATPAVLGTSRTPSNLDLNTVRLREPLPIEEAERLAAMFKALADPIRLRLRLRLPSVIASHDSGEACVCELTASGFSVTGPTISHHLKVLREAGLIEGTRRGT
jgi:DNA-binding transcriptional ArsR family regulator